MKLRYTHGKPKIPNRKVSINLLRTNDGGGFEFDVEGKCKHNFSSVTVSLFI
jgi:hypothetical protein